MIPAPPGLVAQYKHSEPEHWTNLPIVAFDEDGRPLVVDAEGRHKTRLVHAEAYANYHGMAEDPYSALTALLPAGGWRVEHIQDDGSKWSEPLVGWGLKLNGDVVPLATAAERVMGPLDVTVAKHCPSCDCETILRYYLREQRDNRETIADRGARIAKHQVLVEQIVDAGGVEGLT
jgi:hypothetical protein